MQEEAGALPQDLLLHTMAHHMSGISNVTAPNAAKVLPTPMHTCLPFSWCNIEPSGEVCLLLVSTMSQQDCI